MREGIKFKDWIVYSTDKSRKMVLDTKENFLSCMEEHFRADRVITPQEVTQAEKVINDHVRAWCRTMSIGDALDMGQPRRCRRALVNNFATIPTLQGLRKDHKSNIGGEPNKRTKDETINGCQQGT